MQYPGTAITDQYPYRSLCGRRLENNLSFASSTGGSPHTCFEDVILSPLASWIFYLALLGFIVYASTSRQKQGSMTEKKRPWHQLVYRKSHGVTSSSINQSELGSNDKNTDDASLRKSTPTRYPKTATFFSILYSLLIIAALLMNVLEIVRLYLAGRSAGLLPFSLASILIILILMHIPIPSHLRLALGGVILVFWIFSFIFDIVKLATLSRLQTIESRAETEYLVSDQIIDVAVYVGLYGLAIIVETVREVQLFRLR